MKNKFEIRGDVTVIFLRYKGESTTTLISTEDLPKVSSIQGRWYAMNVGSNEEPKIYVGTNIGGVTIYLHQIIAQNPPNTVVDHYNHCTLDNRRENLISVSRSENGQNRKSAQKNNRSSGLRNVYRTNSGTWYVRLVKNGRRIYVGTFKTIEEANQAAIEARKKYFHSAS